MSTRVSPCFSSASPRSPSPRSSLGTSDPSDALEAGKPRRTSRRGPGPGLVPGELDCLLRRIHILPTIMQGPPRTQYAKSGRVHIAYQVLGEGPLDLVLVHGWLSHLELLWDHPAAARSLRRLASFSRLILFDKRGTGLSDPVPVDQLPTLEQRMEDVRAVMDAVGSERAALMGTSE